jgi:hypothetical protein
MTKCRRATRLPPENENPPIPLNASCFPGVTSAVSRLHDQVTGNRSSYGITAVGHCLTCSIQSSKGYTGTPNHGSRRVQVLNRSPGR